MIHYELPSRSGRNHLEFDCSNWCFKSGQVNWIKDLVGEATKSCRSRWTRYQVQPQGIQAQDLRRVAMALRLGLLIGLIVMDSCESCCIGSGFLCTCQRVMEKL